MDTAPTSVPDPLPPSGQGDSGAGRDRPIGLSRLGQGSGRRSSLPKVAALGITALIIAYLALVPVIYLIRGTFFDGQNLTLDFFREAYSAYGLGRMASNSLIFAVGGTVTAMILGTTLAYLAVRTDAPFRGLLLVSAIVPLILPGILYTISWVFLASPRIGLYNVILEPIFGPEAFSAFSMTGMIVVQGFHLAPLVFLLMYAAFRSMDPALEEAAIASGARMHHLIVKISLPLARPALVGAVLVMMVLSLEAFEVPAILGIPSGQYVFTTRIYRVLTQFPPDYGQAGAYAVTLLLMTSVGIYLQSRMLKGSQRYQTISGKAFRPRPLHLGRWRPVAGAFVVFYAVVGVIMPLGILLHASLQPFYSAPSATTFQTMTLKNFEFALANDETISALRTSIILGLGSATAVMFVMAVASWIVVRSRIRGRWLLDNLATLPLAIPGVVMGVALLFVYLRSPLPIYGSIWILFIAFFTRFMPYGMRYASNSMFQLSRELEESAQASGATWWQMFRKIDLPLLTPGLLAGWIYVFLVSIRELSSAILLYSPAHKTLSVIIWGQWQNGQLTDVAALGVLMVVSLIIIVVLAHRLGARFGVRER